MVTNKSAKFPDYMFVAMRKASNFLPWGEVAFHFPTDTPSKWEAKKKRVEYWGKNGLGCREVQNDCLTGFRFVDGQGNKVFDPRGYCLSLEEEAIAYILQHATVIKGTILDRCKYATDGRILYLLPENTPLFIAAGENTERVCEKVNRKELRIGNKIELESGEVGIYYGSHHFAYTKSDYYYSADLRNRNYNVSDKKQDFIWVQKSTSGERRFMTAQKFKISRILENNEMSQDEALLELNETLARNDYINQKGNYSSKKDFLIISGSPFEKGKAVAEFEVIADPFDPKMKERSLYGRTSDGKYFVISQDAFNRVMPTTLDCMPTTEEEILTRFPTWRSDTWRRKGLQVNVSDITILGVVVKYPLLSDGKEFIMPVYR